MVESRQGEAGDQDSRLSDVSTVRARVDPAEYLRRIPGSAVVVLVIVALLVCLLLTSQTYRDTFDYLWVGVRMTIRISVLGYGLALVVGLIAGLGRVSKNRSFRSVSTLYVEIGRGVPLLVQMLYVGFVIAPVVVRWMGIGRIDEPTRAIVGLAFCSGAFLAEVFRAGIESIGRGQTQAARSLGMTYVQALWYVILPQAVRNMLPALANEFISTLKASSLASPLAVKELTHQARLLSGRTFATFTTWNVAALIYLVMTVSLSIGAQALERRRKKYGS
jgi:polar amino acid transport system permease protein